MSKVKGESQFLRASGGNWLAEGYKEQVFWLEERGRRDLQQRPEIRGRAGGEIQINTLTFFWGKKRKKKGVGGTKGRAVGRQRERTQVYNREKGDATTVIDLRLGTSYLLRPGGGV